MLTRVIEGLRQRGMPNLSVRFFFCEKDPAAFALLKAFADTQTSVDIHLFQGEFEQNLQAISAKIDGGFTFTFIDPTGFGVHSGPITAFLKAQNGEFLFNFMSDYINRFAEFEDVKAAFGALLADPQWQQRYHTLSKALPREQRILTLLREAFRIGGAAKYLPDILIRKPKHNRPQMRLILGTNSPFGVEVFRRVHKKVELAEVAVVDQIKQGDQVSMFPPEQVAADYQAHSGFGCKVHQTAAADLCLKLLRAKQPQPFSTIWPVVLSEVPLLPTDLKRILAAMQKGGQVAYTLPPKKKVLQEDTQIRLNDVGGLGF